MKITLSNRQLHALVKPVVPFACTDDYLESLHSVSIRRHGDYLVAAATDRFRVGMTRVKVEEMPKGEFACTVRLPEIARLLALFRPGRRSLVKQPRLTLSIAKGVLHAEALPPSTKGKPGWYRHDDEAHDFASLQVGCKLVEGNPPDLFKLVRERLAAATEQAPSTVGVNMAFLAEFQNAVKHLDPADFERTQAVSIHLPKDPGKPLLVRAGDNFVGLLMPRRLIGSEDWTPAYQPTNDPWPELLSALSEREVEASKRKALAG